VRTLPPALTRVLAIGVVLAVIAVAVVAGVLWWRGSASTLEGAARYAPADAQRLSWTHWEGVRRELGADVDADSSPGQVGAFLDDAFAADLSTTSALAESTEVMQAEFGFSPASIEWELFSQGSDGAVEVLGMGDGFDADALADTLAEVGYTEPEDGATDGGVWRGGADLLASIGQLTPELQYVAVLGDEGVVLTSDRPGYLETAVSVADGDGEALESTEAVVDRVVDEGGDPLAASVYTGSYACEHLAMAQADPTEQEQGEALVEQAGEVHPMTGFALARGDDDRVRVAMSFEDDDKARTNADTRAALAAGSAPGQGGDFADRFSIESAGAEGEVVLLTLRPVEGAYVLSDLGSGPVLFATC
jgi:hypothetical protein